MNEHQIRLQITIEEKTIGDYVEKLKVKDVDPRTIDAINNKIQEHQTKLNDLRAMLND